LTNFEIYAIIKGGKIDDKEMKLSSRRSKAMRRNGNGIPILVEPQTWRPWWGKVVKEGEREYIQGRYGMYPVRIRITGRKSQCKHGLCVVRCRIYFENEGKEVPGWVDLEYLPFEWMWRRAGR